MSIRRYARNFDFFRDSSAGVVCKLLPRTQLVKHPPALGRSMHVICKRIHLQRARHLVSAGVAPSVTSSVPRRDLRSRALSKEAMALVYPDPIRIPAKAAHTGSVVWLHGLGDTGAGCAAKPLFEH